MKEARGSVYPSEMGNATVLLAANSCWNLANFRAPIIEALTARGIDVVAAAPEDDAAAILRCLGVVVHDVSIDARGVSPARDARLAFDYYRLFKRLRPDTVLAFTAKPNIYGSMAAARLNIPIINTISGLGTGFLTGSVLETIMTFLYRRALRSSARVFFHNEQDRDLFVARRIASPSQAAVVAGSGVNLRRFAPAAKQVTGTVPTFLFVGRPLRDKGALEFAQAASAVRKSAKARFQMLGAIEEHPKAVPYHLLKPFIDDGSVEMLGQASDVRPFMAAADCIVLPSYREGLPRVLLEASAMAKAIIATNAPGCRDAVDDGVTGVLCEPRSSEALAAAILSVAAMSVEDRLKMGERARRKAERDFAEEIVVEAYLSALSAVGVATASKDG